MTFGDVRRKSWLRPERPGFLSRKVSYAFHSLKITSYAENVIYSLCIFGGIFMIAYLAIYRVLFNHHIWLLGKLSNLV